MPDTKVGLTFSGGGIRAVVFHFGVLQYLAETRLWNSISHISTVSGGSLAIGLVLARAGFEWPTPERLSTIIDQVNDLNCTTDLQRTFILNHFLRPYLARWGRANLLADALARTWGIDGALPDLPTSPQWWTNTTCYETGRNWSFSKREMGDYVVGYYDNPETMLQVTLAASAAVPVAVGPLKLRLPDTKPRQLLYRKPPGAQALTARKFVTLWDGGVYENLGVEKVFRVAEFASPVNFLVASDASAPLGVRIGRWSREPPFHIPMHRLVDVATEQGRSYRVRALMNFLIKNPDRGAFIKIGNTPRYIFEQAQKPLPAEYPDTLDSMIDKIWLMDTTLRRLSRKDFSDLRLHGYWTAKATFEAWLSPSVFVQE